MYKMSSLSKISRRGTNPETALNRNRESSEFSLTGAAQKRGLFDSSAGAGLVAALSPLWTRHRHQTDPASPAAAKPGRCNRRLLRRVARSRRDDDLRAVLARRLARIEGHETRDVVVGPQDQRDHAPARGFLGLEEARDVELIGAAGRVEDRGAGDWRGAGGGAVVERDRALLPRRVGRRDDADRHVRDVLVLG